MIGKPQKLSALLLALLLSLSLVLPVAAAEEATDGYIVVLFTNDTHCAVDQVRNDQGEVTTIGFAALAAYVKAMEASLGRENITLVDAGDATQGDAIGTLSQGSYLIDILNHLDYDILVPGNHEFDYGMTQFLSLADKAQGNYLSCNFKSLTTGKPVFDPYEIINYDGFRVAYVGICTPESFTKSNPAYFQNDKGEYTYTFAEGNQGQDLYDTVQATVDSARKEGADLVVAVSHLGSEGITPQWSSPAVIQHTTGIDVMIDGHSHTNRSQNQANAKGENVLLVQTGSKLANLGKLTIDKKTGGASATLLPASIFTEEDPETKAYLNGIQSQYQELVDTVVATTAVDLTVNDPATGNRAIRNAETNLGDLCADAYREMLGADVALVNGGGIRADLPAGDITYGDILAVHPYGNETSLVQVTGQQILDALEMGVRMAPEENGGFLQVSGLHYTIEAIPSSVVTDDKGNFTGVSGTRRVQNVTLEDGKALDPIAKYTLASHDYLLKQGGDGFTMFGEDNITVLQSSVMIDNQVLIRFFTEKLAGTVGNGYADPYGQGRITVHPSGPALPFQDIELGRWSYDDVAAVYGVHLMDGVSNTSFAPTAPATRGMLVTIFWRMADTPYVQDEPSFSDIDYYDWFRLAADWGKQTGIVTGNADGTFAPNAPITREQLVTMLYRWEQKFGDGGLSGAFMIDMGQYTDLDQVSDYASEAFVWANINGIVDGLTPTTLAPQAGATREQVAVMLARYLQAAA